MISRLSGHDVTTEHLLQVIVEMSERSTKKMLLALRNETHVETAVGVPGAWNHKVYCQDRRTSLGAPGIKVPAICLPLVETPIIEFSPRLLCSVL